jgi:hypothetical protein
MGVCCDRERAVVGGHDQFSIFGFLPEQRSRQVNGVESPEFGRHRLCRPLKYGRSDFNDFKGTNHFEDASATTRHLRIGKLCPDAKATQRPQAFDGNQSTRNALMNIAPLPQGIGLPESETEQY